MDKNLLIPPTIKISDAISKLVECKKKVLFVVSEGQKLMGIFTNGDMRNYFLTGQELSKPIIFAMNTKPIIFSSLADAQKMRDTKRMVVYPIVDDNNILLDALFEKERNDRTILGDDLRNIPLVIMAGGKGTRLYPYTKVLPKALIPIGEYTIAERIIHSFARYGCSQIHMILNHKANMIKAYFSDIEKSYSVFFYQENNFYGTAGGLYLIRDKIKSTFMVSNCDILIDDDLACAYHTHKNCGNTITFICSMKKFSIPYGVIAADADGQITTITEKPEFNYFINTGVYVIEPEIIDLISPGEYIHMPELAHKCKQRGCRVGIFPISEASWMDMGQLDNMENMIKALQ